MAKRILYPLSSALLLSLPWLGGPSFTLLIAFVPLLILQANLTGQTNPKELPKQKKQPNSKKQTVRKGKPSHAEQHPARLWPYVMLTFALWWAATTWWVGFAAVIGAVFAVIFGTALTTSVFMLYHAVWRRAPRALAYTILVAGWIAYENLYTYGQISFPWLTLGNGFANDVRLVQWYEYTGVFGGSLWVWICNLLLFNALKHKKQITSWIAPAVGVALPAIGSLILYYTYPEPEQRVSVSMIQPNFDPYTEKFAMDPMEQHRTIVELMQECPAGTDFIVAPETALQEIPWEEQINDSYGSLQDIQLMIRNHHPGATAVSGATTRRAYLTKEEASPTARTRKDLGYWYDVYNSALVLDSTARIGIHHKSKLVAGAEMIPYPEIFAKLEFLTLQLGGISGQLGVDSIRQVFTTPQGVRHGTAICYESIYGEYFTEFVRNGVEIMFIITNDGWWRNTSGYRNHFSFARLRAIENRRSIGRSANTGISGLIDERGNVVQKLGWDVEGIVSGELSLNDRITFYTRYGDIIGRVAGYVFVLSLLYFMAYRVRKKSHLVE